MCSMINQLRTFLTVLFLSICLFILFPAASHPATRHTIGVVFSADIPEYNEIDNAFRKILKEKGYTNKTRFITQHPNPDPLAWSNSIRKLIAYDAEIIIVYGSGAFLQAVYETDSIPIVFASVYAPERLEIRNRKNVTGVGFNVPVSSLIRYLKKMKKVKRLGVIFSEIEPDSVLQMEDVIKACERFSIQYIKMPVQKCKQVEERLKLYMYDSLFLTNSAVLGAIFSKCANVPKSLNAPIITTMKGLDGDVNFSLSPDSHAQARELANIIISLLKGKKPKVRIIKINKLVFNLRLTMEMNLQLPIELISGADRIIK